MKAALGLLVSLSVSGCAIVHVHGPRPGDIEVKQRFGIVSVDVRSGAAATVVEATSVGVLHGVHGLAVGYQHATQATLPPGDCRIVLWLRSAEDWKELQGLLDGRTDVCVVPPADSSRRKP